MHVCCWEGRRRHRRGLQGSEGTRLNRELVCSWRRVQRAQRPASKVLCQRAARKRQIIGPAQRLLVFRVRGKVSLALPPQTPLD